MDFPPKPYGKTIGQVLKPTMGSVCKHAGFQQAELILDWEKIVGTKVAQCCKPVRIQQSAKKPCLYLDASPATASQMLYEIPIILEKIKCYFGNPIVADIRFTSSKTRPTWGK